MATVTYQATIHCAPAELASAISSAESIDGVTDVTADPAGIVTFTLTQDITLS